MTVSFQKEIFCAAHLQQIMCAEFSAVDLYRFALELYT